MWQSDWRHVTLKGNILNIFIHCLNGLCEWQWFSGCIIYMTICWLMKMLQINFIFQRSCFKIVDNVCMEVQATSDFWFLERTVLKAEVYIDSYLNGITSLSLRSKRARWRNLHYGISHSSTMEFLVYFSMLDILQ